MADHQPGTSENPFHLIVVHRLIAEDAAVEFAGGGVDDGVLPRRAHLAILLPAGDDTGVGVALHLSLSGGAPGLVVRVAGGPRPRLNLGLGEWLIGAKCNLAW